MKMQFPLPTTYQFVQKGKKNPVDVDVEHWIELDFMSVTDAEAPVAARFDKDFPEGVYESGYGHQAKSVPYQRPPSEIRVLEGALYVPLFHYHQFLKNWPVEAQTAEHAPVRVGVDDFLQRFTTGHRAFINVFEEKGLKPRDDGSWAHSCRNLDKIFHLVDGKLPKLHQVEGTVVGTNRAWLERDTQQFTKEIIFINDDAWVKTREPVLRVEMTESSATVEISLFRYSGRFDEKAHVFQLGRLDDCLSHLRENFPSHRVVERFANLDVLMPEVFSSDDELGPIHGAARTLCRTTSRGLRHLTPDQADAWYTIRDLVAGIDEETEESADRLSEALDLYVSASEKAMEPAPAWVKAASERWKWRPVADNGVDLNP